MADELVDSLDEHGNTVGTIMKNEAHRTGAWHRAAHIYLQNEKDELLLSLRSGCKEMNPNKWETCGGHVAAGDSTRATAKREVHEELGLDINEKDFRYLFTYQSRGDFGVLKEREFVDVFLVSIKADIKDIKMQDGEVDAVKFVTLSDFFNNMVKQKETTLDPYCEEYLKVTPYLNKSYSRIETPRLVLREWTMNDIDDLVEGLGNFEVAKYMGTPFPYTDKEALEFISKVVAKPNDAKEMYFAVYHKKDKKVIGGTGISFDKNGDAEGGLWLNAKYHGKGYGAEFFSARAKHCFDVLGVNRLISGAFEDNTISCNLHKKLGFRPSGDDTVKLCPARGKELKVIGLVLDKGDFTP